LAVVIALAASTCTKKAPPSQAANTAVAAIAQPASDDLWPAGIVPSKLDGFKRKVFDQVVNREASACGKGHSLRQSLKQDSDCRASFYAVRYVVHLADAGFSASEITQQLDRRFRVPRYPHIDLSQAPCKGNPSARVTIAEFVDYECPHCKLAQAMMHELLEEYPNDVRVCFKHNPWSSHVNARWAAQASVAAHKQGKFWPYSEKVWENSEHLTPAVLDSAAQAVGLDILRWRKDRASDESQARVQQDLSEGRDLGIKSTPAIFINGRKYEDAIDSASLKDWIDEELGRQF